MSEDLVTFNIETVTIPTYRTGEPNKNPMFLEKRVYQGSSGVVYPYPVIDKVFDDKQDKEWNALFLENRWLKIMIFPEIGGRLQMAMDKTNDYHFIYYNRVIKPALVGLCGPWISGGIEFNWPQHHRPGTFSPVDWELEEHEDGSKTVWCSETERMFRTKGMHGFRLYPDRAYVEINVKLYNRTQEPQTFLWWANPAVAVNDDYESVFPPDVHAVMDHGKRAVSEFPVARGEYYKHDYSPGTNIARYKNIPVPTSYMAFHSEYDFLGCYDHGKKAGMIHVANHHLVPGKKQWTWGNGDFGRAWDRQLTDEDGPYIELMCGAFTDNQPDFSWLMPGEEKSFSQVFMPYKSIGPATNASREAVVHLAITDKKARLGVYVTRPGSIRIELITAKMDKKLFHNHKNMTWPRMETEDKSGFETLFSKAIAMTPADAFFEEITLPEATDKKTLSLRVYRDEKMVIDFTPGSDESMDVPEPARPARPPEEIETNEELFLNGLHLEQYRHATYPPEPYYLEALKRDPSDSRCNNAMGLLQLRRGKFKEAESFFRKTIGRLTHRNPNPYDGEAYYNLGLSLKMQGRINEAYDAFYKAVWNDAWQSAGYFELACLDSRKHDYSGALDLVEKSMIKNAHHHKARHLRAVLLRYLDRRDEALAENNTSLKKDAFNYGCQFELNRLYGKQMPLHHNTASAQEYIETALDYANAGFFDEALEIVNSAPHEEPMLPYYAGYFEYCRHETGTAVNTLKEAAGQKRDYCFPQRIECIPVLDLAMEMFPEDALAPYALGNFWYAHRQYDDAIAVWEHSVRRDDTFPTVWRNLGLAYMNKKNDPMKAQRALEKAFALDSGDARILFELDQLYRKLKRPPEERLAILERNGSLIRKRDDLMIEWITLLNLLGRHEEAMEALMNHTFHPWEGGEGKVTGQYKLTLVQQSLSALERDDRKRAIELLEKALQYPDNLGEGKLEGTRDNDIYYYLGCACEGIDKEKAEDLFKKASSGSTEPVSPMYYNDQPPEMILYQGLAFRKRGQTRQADDIFDRLIAYGKTHRNDDVPMDYFAVSLPDFLVFEPDLKLKNKIHCTFMEALGYAALGQKEEAGNRFDQLLELDPNHVAIIFKKRFGL